MSASHEEATMDDRSRGEGGILRSIAIEELRPNPFRRLDEYPIIREKVDALKRSIETTGFWGTIVARPADDGHVEIAFGHHRLIALRESFGPKHEVQIIVRDLSNEDMLRMIAHENMEEWGAHGWVEMETVRATLDAAAKGLITLPEVPKKTKACYIKELHLSQAPGVLLYTRSTVAEFIGWTRKNNEDGHRPTRGCDIAFRALELIEKGLINEPDLKQLSRDQMEQLIAGVVKVHEAQERVARQNRREAQEARQLAQVTDSEAERRRLEREAAVRDEQEQSTLANAGQRARDFGQQAGKAYREQGAGHAEIRSRAAAASPVADERPLPNIDDLARRVQKKLGHTLNGEDDMSKYLKVIAEFRDQLSPLQADGLCESAAQLRARLVRRIEQVFRPPLAPQLPLDGAPPPPFDPGSAW
jgi:hypothetical protein